MPLACFESAITELSAELAALDESDLDRGVERAAQRLGPLLGVDRIALVESQDDTKHFGILCSWTAAGINPVPPLLVPDQYPWLAARILAGEPAAFERPDQLPVEAVLERDYCRQHGMKSHVAVPLRIGSGIIGTISLGMFRSEVRWPDSVVRRLRCIGEVLAASITRRRSRAQLQRAHAELAHVTRAASVGQLAGSIAHEINQPLCALVSNAQAALRMLGLARPDIDDVRAALHDIVADGKRAGEVVRRAHALLKKQDVKRVPLNLNQIVETVAALIHSHALIRRVNVRLVLDSDLPQVLGDRVQLQQVVLNLVNNGIEAIPDSESGPRELVIATRSIEQIVSVSVRDSGHGLPLNVASRVFQPFFTTKPQGLGMGLAISRAIVESHGGRMWFTENDSQGMTFGFSVPVALEEAA